MDLNKVKEKALAKIKVAGESISGDFRSGGIKKTIKNNYVIGLIIVVAIGYICFGTGITQSKNSKAVTGNFNKERFESVYINCVASKDKKACDEMVAIIKSSMRPNEAKINLEMLCKYGIQQACK